MGTPYRERRGGRGGSIIRWSGPPDEATVSEANDLRRRRYGRRLEGAGIGRTILTAAAGMPDQTRIISTDGKLHVTRASFTDFTIDGNAANQPDAACMVGIQCGATVGAVHERILIHDVKGSASGEGALFDSYGAVDCLYVECEAARRLLPVQVDRRDPQWLPLVRQFERHDQQRLRGRAGERW